MRTIPSYTVRRAIQLLDQANGILNSVRHDQPLAADRASIVQAIVQHVQGVFLDAVVADVEVEPAPATATQKEAV